MKHATPSIIDDNNVLLGAGYPSNSNNNSNNTSDNNSVTTNDTNR